MDRTIRTIGFVQTRALGGLAALLFVLGCAPTMTSVRQHPDFASEKRTLRAVALLPLEVEHTSINFGIDRERDAHKELQIRGELFENIKAELEKRGYAVNDALLDRMNGDDEQFGLQYQQLGIAYAQASDELYKRRAVPVDESVNFNVSLGSIANTVSAAGGADGLLVVRYWGYEKSGGRMMQDIFVGALIVGLGARSTSSSRSSSGKTAPPRTSFGVQAIGGAAYGRIIEVALIDGASGNVLWANAYGESQEGIGSMLARAMATLPARAPSLNTEPSGP